MRSPGAVDFVIVGAQKAGSTHLGACLLDHPEVFLCRDEVPYFEDPFYSATPASELHRVFAQAQPGQRRGIHRPDYLARPECPARIRADAPAARILAVLRDPVARAISAYCWYVQFGLLPFEPAEVGLRRLLEGWSDPGYPHAGEVIEYGLYARHLRRYVAAFGRDQVLVLLSDELSDPGGLARVYRFLGVDPGHVPAALTRRSNEGVYDMRRLRVLRARRRLAFSWDSATRYTYRPRRRRKAISFLPNAVIVGLDQVLLARLFGNDKPELPETLIGQMRQRYAEDVDELAILLDRDLSAWTSSCPPVALGE
ncbi:MAG: sulfotransferase domain-containing protein [Egibacteraceae bacterium]